MDSVERTEWQRISDSSRYFAGRKTEYDDYDEDDDDPISDDESLDDDNVNIRPEDDEDE